MDPSRRSRLRALSASFATAVGLLAASASASVAVARPDGAVHVQEERMAMASTPERTVVWEQLTFDVARGDVAWIVAVPKGGWIEAADDGWLDALDGGSAPVIAPSQSLACGVGSSTPHDDTAMPFKGLALRGIDRALLAPTPPLLALDALRAKGWSIDARTAAMLADLDAAGEEIEVLQLAPGAVGPTRTIRVIGPARRPFPSTLLPVAAPSPTFVAFVLDATRVQLSGAPAIVPKFDALVWEGGKASNYDALLDDAISSAGSGVAVPFASPDALLADQPMGPLENGPSVMRRYFHADDAAATGPWACAHRSIDAAVGGGVVAPTCAVAPPWPSDAPLPACASAPTSALSPSSFMCGDADDLAVALGGATPSATWITRWQATVAVESSRPLPLDDAHAGALPAFHEAATAKQGACDGGTTSPPPPPTGNPNNGGNPYGSNDPNADNSSSSDGDVSSARSGCDATFGCATHSSSSGSDGCGSSSSGSSSDGCSSSSDGGSSGGGCGSSSGSSSDSGCGKGSGGGSSSDNGCGGSSSSGSSGGCGGGGGGSDNGCSISPRKTRVRATPFGYLAVALAVLARRATRRRRHS